MQRATLLVLTTLALGLGAFVYFYEIRGKPQREAEADARARLFDIDQKSVQRVEVGNQYGTFVFTRQGTSWMLDGSPPVRADETAVQDVLFTLNELRADQTLESVEDLALYGLDSPRIRVTVSTGAETFRLLVGDDTPFGGKTYVQVGDEASVKLVSVPVVGKLNRKRTDWRDRRVLSFAPSKVSRLGVARADGTSYEVYRDGASWKLSTPPHYRVDSAHFSGLLYDLDGLTAVAFTGSTDLKEHGLDPPRLRVWMEEEGEQGEVRHELLFGRPDMETRRVPVVTKPGEEVRLIRVSLLERLEKPIDELRDTRVVPVERFVVGKLEVRIEGETLEAEKKKGEWAIDGTLASHVGDKDIEALLDDLAELEAEVMIDDVPEGEWSRFGLDTPWLSASLSETDPNGEVVRTFELTLGRVDGEEGRRLFARVADDPTIYQVNPVLADDLQGVLLKRGAGAGASPTPGRGPE